MCNLYRMTKGVDEVARLFSVAPHLGANFGSEIYPGYPGIVVAEGRARIMTWGFPPVLKSKKISAPLKPKPVNNAREDKLGAAFWRDSFATRRCLIPVTAWAEAEGEKGRMTRNWYSLHGEEDHHELVLHHLRTLASCSTPEDQLVAGKPRRALGLTEDQLATMQRESKNVDRQFRAIEQSYSSDQFDLMLAAGYVNRLLGNARLARHLAQYHDDNLAEFQKLNDLQRAA